jgi:hypothetical protein
MNTRLSSLALGLLLLLVSAVPAVAAPVTVNLRVEGKTATHYEAPVTVDVRTVDGHDGSGAHTCDTTGAGGASSPTAGGALAKASETAPFAWKGTWFASFSDFSVDTIDGETPNFGADATFWGFWVNGAFASAGVCSTKVQEGDRVLLAVATGSEKALALAGPASANKGTPVPVTVTDGSGAPQAGASVGGALTGADGKASVSFASTGTQALKASAPNAIRSNALSVCVHDGDDGTCGTTKPGATTATPAPTPTTAPAPVAVADRVAPKARLSGLANGTRFAAGKGPRELAGTVAADPSGIVAVKLRLTRRSGGRCEYYSGRKEAFRATRCGRSFFFKIGDDADWTYLLPKKLAAGRYVLDVVAIDRAGNRDTLERGRSRAVFTVS